MSFLKGTFPDPENFSQIDFLSPIPDSSVKGCLSKLDGTKWEKEFPTVKKQDYEDATFGDPYPLRRSLGSPPLVRARRLPVVQRLCKYSQDESCLDRSEKCKPGSGKLPECYCAPFEDFEASKVATEVGKAWDEGRYVFIIE